MAYELKTDLEIAEVLGEQYDLLRRTKGIQNQELIEKGGANTEALHNFKTASKGITLITFIRLMRGIGELERLEKLFGLPETYSPSGKIPQVPAKRVGKKKVSQPPVKWTEK